jgi:protein SCO1/2
VRSARLAAGFLSLLIVAGCGQPSAREEAAPLTSAARAEPSIFDLDIVFTNQDGEPTTLAELAGRPIVAAMMFTNCKSVCPRIAEDMKGLDQLLSAEERARVRFIMFSLDPENDTPAALRGFARDHHLDTARWTLLAGSEDGVRDLAAALGIKYRPGADGQIAHSASIFAIDSRGVIRRHQEGLGRDPGELLAAIKALD